MQNQDGNEPSGQSRSALCRQWCDQNCCVCVISSGFLVLSLIFLLLYIFWDGEWDMVHRKTMLIWMGVFLVIAFLAFLVAFCPAPEQSQQELRRRVRRNERFPIPNEPQSPPTSASTGDSGFRSNFTRSLRSIIASFLELFGFQVQSGESSGVNSSDPASAARTPENLQGSSTTASGSSLPEDSVAVLSPENSEPSLQVQADVNSADSDSVQTPQSGTNASGSSLPEDSMERAVNPEIPGPSRQMQPDVNSTNSDSVQTSQSSTNACIQTPQSSTDASGSSLPEDSMEMNPEQGGNPQKVQGDGHATDSVQTPTEEQVQSKTDTADLGTNLPKDGEMVEIDPKQQRPSTSQ